MVTTCRPIAGLLAIAAALLAPAPAPAAAPPTAAVTLADPVLGIGVHQLDARSVAALGALGVRHVRVTLYADLWERDAGWRQEFEQGLARADAAEIEVLVVAHAIDHDRLSPKRRAETAVWFAQVMERAARRYSDQIRYWQLWNEMDVAFTDAFGAVSGLPMRERGRLYAEQLKLAYPLIKAANPRAVIITGGIASPPDEGFLDAVLAAGGPFDVAAVHSYGYPLWGVFESKAIQSRAVLTKHGATRRPLWNTEFGLEAKQVPWVRERGAIDELQQTAWRRVVEGNDAARLYDRVYGYQLWTDEDTGHGILRKDFTPRPAFRWVQGRMKG